MDQDTDSRPVSSNQAWLHPRLAGIVQRHLDSRHQRPVAPHNRAAFKKLLGALAAAPRPLVLDSFCGTGTSTAILAARHPDHLVIGIDKSAHRLARHNGSRATNYLLLQADCEDIWQLLLSEQLYLDYHYLLYPNPWPKAKHLQRRIHAHAAFPWLLRLGGRVELRSNWQVYVEEFGVAMHLAGSPGRVSRVDASSPVTLFEQKYHRSGHQLWAFTGRVRQAPAPAT